MSNRFKRKGKSKFIMIDGYVKRSAAWKALTPIERNAYLEVKWRYDGTNNGRIGLGVRELGDELNMGRNTGKLALDRLQEVGFIAKTKSSSFNVKNRSATEWRLTEYHCDVTGELPTKDFMRWVDKEKQQSYPSDAQSYPADTGLPKIDVLIGISPTHRTVKPKNVNSQSYPSDTYRSTIGGKV